MTGHPSPLRVGRIPYANLVPIFHGLATGGVPGGVSFVDGHPSELNRKLRDGELDLSPSSSIEYAVRPDRYLLCPGISISSRRRVMSVLLLSNGPLRQLPPEPIAVTGSSDTSITLLEILLRESLGRANLLVRTELPAREALRRYPAHLVIGDEAIRAAVDGVAPHVTDLGEWWRRETGKPFVFALWIAARSAWEDRRESPVPVLRRPSRGETDRAGVDPPWGIPVGRPRLDPPGFPGRLLALPLLRPRGGGGGSFPVLRAGGENRPDPGGATSPLPRNRLATVVVK